MTVKVWTKQATQRIITGIRQQGIQIDKDAQGRYISKDAAGKVVFSALPGSRTYLVKYDDNLFTPVN